MTTQVGAVTIDTTVLDKLTEEAQPRATLLVTKYGMAVLADAMRLAPVDTGALKNSLPTNSRLEDALTYIVSDGVEYGIFQELGTSKMAAQPFLIPALEKWRQKFTDAFAELVK